MKHYKTVELFEKKNILTNATCDICGKVIESGSYYFHVCNHHNEWGADSSDSLEQRHICETDCLTKVFNEYNTDTCDSRAIEVKRMRMTKYTQE